MKVKKNVFSNICKKGRLKPTEDLVFVLQFPTAMFKRTLVHRDVMGTTKHTSNTL